MGKKKEAQLKTKNVFKVSGAQFNRQKFKAQKVNLNLKNVSSIHVKDSMF